MLAAIHGACPRRPVPVQTFFPFFCSKTAATGTFNNNNNNKHGRSAAAAAANNDPHGQLRAITVFLLPFILSFFSLSLSLSSSSVASFKLRIGKMTARARARAYD